MFSLSNDDDDVTLTHFGQSLSEIEKFEDPALSDEEEDGYRDGENERGKLGGTSPSSSFLAPHRLVFKKISLLFVSFSFQQNSCRNSFSAAER